MSYEQYWYGNVWLIADYREAEKFRMDAKNRDYWLQGMYIYEALLDASPLYHDLAPKGTTAHAYSKEPYILTPNISKIAEVKEKQRIENERKKAIAFFEQWANANQNIG